MKILYACQRINSDDGSAIHGREFARGAAQLGHEIRTFPDIKPRANGAAKHRSLNPAKRPGRRQQLKSAWRRTKRALRRTNPYVSELVSWGEGVSGSFRQRRLLREIVAEFRPDVVVLRPAPFYDGVQWICKEFGLPCVLELNCLVAAEKTIFNRQSAASFLTRWWEQRTIRRADAAFGVTKQVKQAIDQYLDASRSRTIANGVDTDTFNPERIDSTGLRRDLGLEGKTVLGVIGSYKPWHGLETTIELIEKLTQHDSKYHLLIIGQGPMYEPIGRAIRERNLDSYVTRLGQITHDQVPQHLGLFDFAVMTYADTPGFYMSPLKMYEYLAMGIPVVTSDVGDLRETIEDGVTGLLVHPPTAENFATAILEIEKSPERLASIRANARKLAVEKLSWRQNAAAVLELCRQAIDLRRGAIHN
ncbi:MAG: glycosyltransferase family 4 protein [Planctomycetales bacterium]|nr:glycosyltransferase family 4 protein [Planctomycetales bacterium]